MRIGKWFKEWFKKQQEFDNELYSSAIAKEITTLLSCPADHQNTECSLVEQLRKKQKELKELKSNKINSLQCYAIDSDFVVYGIAFNKKEACLVDGSYLKMKFLKSIEYSDTICNLEKEISELKQQLGIE